MAVLRRQLTDASSDLAATEAKAAALEAQARRDGEELARARKAQSDAEAARAAQAEQDAKATAALKVTPFLTLPLLSATVPHHRSPSPFPLPATSRLSWLK